MKTKQLLSILVIFLMLFSCKKGAVETDNIYKFKEYISYTTSGVVSVAEKITVNLAKEVVSWDVNQEISSNILSIKPYVNGKIKAINKHAFIFIPDENLDSNTEYTVTVKLDEVYKDISKDFKNYTFQFKTIAPNFKIDIKTIQSYSKEYQYLEGVLESADVISLENAKKIIQASQKGIKKNIVWQEFINKGTFFEFKIDSVQRFNEDSKLKFSWNGTAINSKRKGENEIIISGKNNFKVLAIKVVNKNEQYISINFSDALKKQQNFDGLVALKNVKTPRFVVNGNELKVFSGSRFQGDVLVSVYQGVKSSDGIRLKKAFKETIIFEQKKPQIRAISNGTILPNSKELKFNFEAINVKEVDVRIIKIFEDNVLQFLQDNDLNSNNESAIKRVGRRVAKETITLIKADENHSQKWKAYSIDISKMVSVDPESIYRIELSFNKNQTLYNCNQVTSSTENNTAYEDDYYQEENESLSEVEDEDEREELYWDNKLYNYKNYSYNWQERKNPCNDAYYAEDKIIAQNLVASNLGIIVKKGANNDYFFAVTNLLDTQPEAGATIKLFNFQQQEILTTKTDSEGFANIESPKNAAFATVSKGVNKGYVKLLDGNSLSLSKFDVSGTKTQKGLKGFIYGERGVWRPGDAMHITFILNDADNQLPKNHPVKLEVTDSSGKLVYKQVTSDNLNNFYTFTVTTSPEAKTGNYSAKISVGGAKFYKTLKVETVKPNRLKIKVDFDDEILTNNIPINGTLDVKWLHGTPAKNLKAEIKAKVSVANSGFKNYKDYIFADPSRDYASEEITVFDGKLDENGLAKVNNKLTVGKNAPGMLNVQFLVRAFENGGDFSIDAFTKKYAPFNSFVGLKSPKGNRYGSFFTDENQNFSIVSVDEKGNPVANRKLDVEVYQIKWRWWWSSSSDNLSRYTSSIYNARYKNIRVTTDTKGIGSFKLKIPEKDRGRFLIRVVDKKSGHATGRTTYFYKNWWQNSSSGDKEAAKMLVFSADKEKYNVGETAKITFPSGSKGRALISIENGTKVLETKWVETNKGTTSVDIPINKNMTPNVFVNISLLQPHQVSENDLPIRLYGVIPILVEDKNTLLEPKILMLDELQPEKEFTVKVSEKNNKEMTYTLAVVEEGLLDLTRFKTPNAYTTFYAREALGVKTWDIFDDVIGAYSGSVDQVFAIGGDGNLSKGKNKKANRFKPVVKFLGPYYLKKGKTATHKITLPNYIGSVRTMVIAGDITTEAFGNAEKAVPVKKPLMVLATLPRKLSPKEKVTLPITIFAMDKKVKNINVEVKTSNGIAVIGNKNQTLNFDKPDEKMLYFELDVLKANGINTVEIIATGAGEKATYKVELDVVNPNPTTSKIIDKNVEAKQTEIINFNTFGVAGSNTAVLELSTMPPINFSGRLAYLIQYPHGCLEQTTSSVFPQLFLNDLFELSSEKKQEVQKNIEKGITRLGNFQKADGGLSYWMGENYTSDWGTSYAGHFMLEAEKKGFVLPITFKSNFIAYQKNAARNWQPSYNRYSRDLSQAYRLYTLALAGSPDLSAMNRLREFKEISNEAKWRLAATYALVGQKEASVEIKQKANLNFAGQNYYNYGSVARNRAMALETMLLIDGKDVKEVAKSIAKDLSDDNWMSTQSTAYSLLSIAKMVIKNGGKAINVQYVNNGKTETIKTYSSMVLRTIDVKSGESFINLKNNENNIVFARIINSGKLPLGEEITENRGLSVSVDYKNLKGKSIDINSLQQGQDFVAKIVVSTPKNESVKDIALTQIFPSGWEIVNTRFTDFGTTIKSKARYTDIRDDRVNFYFDLNKSNKNVETKTFTVLLNAAYLGTYYLPGIQAEAMYDNDYLVRTKGRWIEVVK
ncbi:Ig-like domain-containing alpha-2-macroglobulin family protein [uncultured Polaribacter sp.]|uniref:alpha-2-macroglobulin family protein n=1 Tax=uncultured Polaribacter sp. TaxID=174711 RepID=UPI0026241529|nr:Ig-like domain-containing alpha-2-macroglobulin family protein [uncultured Polaribacter sp.]